MTKTQRKTAAPSASLLSLLKPYRGTVVLLVLLAMASNGINLVIPKLISHGIDSYAVGKFNMKFLVISFLLAALGIFLFTYLQSIVQTLASERVARDLRQKLSSKISRQTFSYVQQVSPSKLLTNLTSDIDSIKMFVSMAVVSITSSVFIIAGVSVLLVIINWKLAIAVLTLIPIIAITFFTVLRKVRALFRKTREVIDWLNKVINESILGSALIRVLNSQQFEYEKFLKANSQALSLGLSIVTLFAGLIPIITFTANMAMVTILALGGHFVIGGQMSLGDFAAFNSYLAMVIFPIIVIGFMSNIIAQANASYQRVQAVLESPELPDTGTIKKQLTGAVRLESVSLSFGQKPALKGVSFNVRAGTRTAIIGPTASGKSQIFNLLTGLVRPDSGEILYDGIPITDFDKSSLLSQIGLVFQDSILFQMTLRENISFNELVTEQAMQKAVDTAQLRDFIDSLPQKLETEVSERGTTLSGGQKQRIMLARAIAINPRILLLDDFTSRVDLQTEKQILENIRRNYEGITLISITQKIAPVEDFDEIILLMEGEVITRGTHAQLLQTSPEYIQIHQSQRSTHVYELQS
ncbi:MAG TPA: ABC transporter ATP-binding protein [Chitinophagaceae bacterium]|nr:ABC transporter ATP-binding protein [Chitinophagaceae bacterium]